MPLLQIPAQDNSNQELSRDSLQGTNQTKGFALQGWLWSSAGILHLPWPTLTAKALLGFPMELDQPVLRLPATIFP